MGTYDRSDPLRSQNQQREERGGSDFLIIIFSYNAGYAKHREVKNLYFPESGLFPRPADLQPSVIPYDSTFAFFIFLCLISILVLQSFYGLTNYKSCTVCRCHARLHFIFPDSLFMLI